MFRCFLTTKNHCVLTISSDGPSTSSGSSSGDSTGTGTNDGHASMVQQQHQHRQHRYQHQYQHPPPHDSSVSVRSSTENWARSAKRCSVAVAHPVNRHDAAVGNTSGRCRSSGALQGPNAVGPASQQGSKAANIAFFIYFSTTATKS